MNSDEMTVPEAAELKGCHRTWINYLIREGRLKARRVGPVYLIRLKDLEACKVRHREKPDSNGHTKTLPQRRTHGKKVRAKTTAKLSASRQGR